VLQVFAGGAPMSTTSRSRARAQRHCRSHRLWRMSARMRGSIRFVTTGGAVVRNQLFLRFGAKGRLPTFAAQRCESRQPADTTMVVDILRRPRQSREVFKTVLDDESRGVFQGKIIGARARRRPTPRWPRMA